MRVSCAGSPSGCRISMRAPTCNRRNWISRHRNNRCAGGNLRLVDSLVGVYREKEL